MAAEILALWRHGGIADHRLRDEVLWATREHDNGWREADACPLPNDDRGLVDFAAVPDTLRQQIWLRGTTRYVNQRPLESLLILKHNRDLHEQHRGQPDWIEFFQQLDELHEQLRESQTDWQDICSLYPHLQRVDTVSLALCQELESAQLPGDYALHRISETGAEVSTFRLTPFPFAGATRFRIAVRWLPKKHWSSSAELTSALARSHWKNHEFLLQP